jgi:hypothetical protein
VLRPRILLLSLLAIGALALPPLASAQPPDDVTVRLTSFAPWAAPDRPLTVAIQITNSGQTTIEDLAIRLTIRDRVRSRSALRVALDRQPQGEILAVTTEELADPLEPGQTATVTIQRDLGSLANAFLPGRGGSGVYPLAIRVQAAEQTIADRSGAFVFLAQAPETQLNVVWVLPIHRATAIDPAGAYDRKQLEAELLQNGSVRGLVEILERHLTASLTLAPSGALLDQLEDVSNGFDQRDATGNRVAVPATDAVAVAAGELLNRLRLAAAAPAIQLATAPYARADIVSLVAADMSFDAQQQIAAGRDTVRRLLGRETDPALFATAAYRADARSARTLATLGARTLVLDPEMLREQPEGRFGNPDRPEEVRASGRTFDALLVDAPARERLQARTDDPVLAAMGVFAEAAVSYFEVPGLAAARTIVLATDSMPSAAIAGPLADALTQAPWIRLRSPNDVVSDPALEPSTEPLRLLTTDEITPERLIQARTARGSVDLLRPVVEAPDLLANLDRKILIAESIDYGRSRQNVATAFARSARATAEATLAGIKVPPRRVTLTSRGGRVPVTVVNETGYTIRVRVRLDSAKVAFPDGASRRVTVEGRPDRQALSTVTFDLEARAAGSFPIEVRIETPDGGRQIGTGQLLVRSTAVSAVAFAATAGGVLFLVGAWARRAFVKRTRAKPAG